MIVEKLDNGTSNESSSKLDGVSHICNGTIVLSQMSAVPCSQNIDPNEGNASGMIIGSTSHSLVVDLLKFLG